MPLSLHRLFTPPSFMRPAIDKTDCHFLCLGTGMDSKELPAPPPPSPESCTAHLCQPIDELLLLSRTELSLHRQRSYSILEADSNRNVATAHHSAPKNSPLRQVSSHVDIDTNGRKSPSPKHRSRREGSLILSSFNNHRVTQPNSAGRERSSSVSSSQGVSKSTSRNASPAFNMAYLRSTIHGIPTTPRASTPRKPPAPSEASTRLPLRGRQISSPIISEQPATPTSFSSPRPVTPSTTLQSRSESFSTQSSELLQKEELVSYFSDSEEEGKRSNRSSSSKKDSFGKRVGQSRRFRRRLSETFAFLACGKD